MDIRKRYTEEQIIGFLKEAEAGTPVKELCRRHGFSEGNYYAWRNKFGEMDVSDAKPLKALETKNSRLKRSLAESLLENEVTFEVLRNNGNRNSQARVGAVHEPARTQRRTFSGRGRDERERVPVSTGAGSKRVLTRRDPASGPALKALRRADDLSQASPGRLGEEPQACRTTLC
ncbi:transposase IS1404 [Salinisphaera japonica YTM-1]|uniref:Transposase IS1404 n=1 Tax=Salinisphaera japonica YTM-1 TaxID=1209778 RepID=A0A423PJ46_9GAMM|nr:transposase IS1404 [Salinisphaera japonica YTM-1]